MVGKFLLHPWAIGLYAVALFWSGYAVNGWRLGGQISAMEAAASDAALDSEKKAREIERLNQQVSDAQSVAAELRARKRETVKEVVINEVVKYVQSDAASDCGLDAAGVRIHNIAASGELPEDTSATGEPDQGTERAPASEVIQVVAANYADCHEYRDQVTGWIEWHRNLLN